MGAVFRKEIRTYFTTMTGYVFLGFFLLVTGFYFSMINVWSGSPYYSSVLSSTLLVLLILIPVLTMRLFSEEARQKTDQLLFTCPVKITDIVLGKFFASGAVFLLAVCISGVYPLILSRFGNVPIAETFGSMTGYALMGLCFIAVGMFISVLTDNQIISAVGTFAAMFFIFMIDSIASLAPVTTASSVIFVCAVITGIAVVINNSTKNIYAAVIFVIFAFIIVGIVYAVNHYAFDGIIAKVLNWFSVLSRYQNFSMGIFSLTDIIYYISFMVAFNYLTVNVIETRRWK